MSRHGRPALLLECTLVGVFAFAFYSVFQDESFFTVFQARDLERAAQVAHGQLIFWGPETTGGGNLPGGFYYWLMSLPLLLKMDWTGAWMWMAILDAAGAAILWWSLRSVWGPLAAATGTLFYVGSSIHILMLKSFWNPSFLPVFVIGFLTAASRAYAEPDRAQIKWPLACLLLGLCLQLHLSAAPFVAALILVQTMGPKFAIARLPWRIWWSGLGLLGVMVAPFTLWSLLNAFGIDIGQAPPESAGRLRDSLGGVLANPANLFDSPQGLWAVVRRLPLAAWKLLPEGAWMVLAFLAFDKIRGRSISTDRSQRLLWVFAVASAFSAVFYFFLPMGTRYALCFLFTLLMVLATYAPQLLSPGRMALVILTSIAPLAPNWWMQTLAEMPWRLAFSVAAVAAFVLSLFLTRELGRVTIFTLFCFLAVLLKSFSPQFGREWRGRFPVNNEVLAAAAEIYQQTGWDFERARRRLHLLNIHREVDLSHLYTRGIRNVVPNPAGTEPPDGYFLMRPARSDLAHVDHARSQILENHPADELAEALKDGALNLHPPRVFGQLALIGFSWRDPDRNITTVHNIGYPHGPAPEDVDLVTAPDPAGVVSLGSQRWLFAWNECEGTPKYGRAAVRVEIESARLNIRVVGRALSQATPWTFPYCTLGWSKLFVRVSCGNTDHRFEVAKNIGLNWIEPPIAARTFLTPFERSYPSPCAQPTRISVGRSHTLIDNNGGIRYLKPSELSTETASSRFN